MKKVLALVLAVMMLSTMAFASTTGNTADVGGDKDDSTIVYTPGVVVPGSKIYVWKGMTSDPDVSGSNNNNTIEKDVTSDNYSLTAIKYEEGRDLVEEIYFDDANEQVVIQLKQDYDLVKAKDLDFTFTLRGKGKTSDTDVHIKTTVGYVLRNGDKTAGNSGIVISTDGEPALDDYGPFIMSTKANGSIPAGKNCIWEVVQDDNVNDVRTDITFTTADEDTEVSVRVYDGERYYLYNDAKADKAILKAYADTDADITFLNFPGEPTFNSTASIYFYKPEDSYVYEVENGKIVDTVDWDDDEGAFILKTRTLGSYIFSDVELETAEDIEENNPVENPDTGANDVVGIAAALGVVALVSAAAVSLKK